MPLDANATAVRDALLTSTTQNNDQVTATGAADVLCRIGALPPGLLVPAGLHPQWVRAQVAAPAATAIFAATNAHDPAALYDLVANEHRVTVLRAALANAFANDQTKALCTERLHGGNAPGAHALPAPPLPEPAPEPPEPNYEDIPRPLRVPETLRRPGFTALDPHDPLRDLPASVLIVDQPVEDITALIERSIALNACAAITQIFCGYYGPAVCDAGAIVFWDAASTHPIDLIETLTPDQQRAALYRLLAERYEDSRAEPLHQWDKRLVELMSNTEIYGPAGWTYEVGTQYLTPEALTLVLATPRLHHLLCVYALSPDTLPEVLAGVAGGPREELLMALDNTENADLIAPALLYDGPGNILDELKEWGFHELLRYLDGPEDPATLVATTFASTSELVAYLFSGEQFATLKNTASGYARRLPPAEQVSYLVELALRAGDLAALVQEVRWRTAQRPLDPAYATALLDHLPAFWERALKGPAADLVMARLLEAAPLDVVMNVLFTEDSLTPATLPELLARLG